MASHLPFDTHLAEQKVKTLVNAQLKSILKRERLAVSGVKAAMQARITDREPRLFHVNPPDVADKLASDPSIRVMIFCASEPISHFSKLDIAFPHQVEIKVNLDEVKANLRGLKNRPGSTRPADITNLLRKRANYENSMSLTYALTHKKFYFIVNLVKQHSVEELVAKLKSGKTISKDQVIRETLQVDRYMNDILQSTPGSVDQVTVEPDGKWSRISGGDSSPRSRQDSSGDDEDLLEIKDAPRFTAVKKEVTTGSGFMRTPPTSSREQSIISSAPPPSAGAKRSTSAVIDLTSDDDEEDIRRRSKRPALPAYPATPTYPSTENGRAQLGGSSFGFRGTPNYVPRGYPLQ
ncbi:MAG: hypothetical protein Q9200_003181 [Gallowayella weberi]